MDRSLYVAPNSKSSTQARPHKRDSETQIRGAAWSPLYTSKQPCQKEHFKTLSLESKQECQP